MSSCEHLYVTPRGDRENPDVYNRPFPGSQPVPDRYSICVTVILATYVLEPNTGGCGFFVQLIMKFRRIYAGMNESSGTPRSQLTLFYLKSFLLLSPIVSCIGWDVVAIVYYHICSLTHSPLSPIRVGVCGSGRRERAKHFVVCI